MMTQANDPGRAFTPPLGLAVLTPLYDLAIALFTREQVWRDKLVQDLAPKPGDVIVDIGCGTGRLAPLIERAARQVKYIGIDPDKTALSRARHRAQKHGLSARFIEGFYDGGVSIDGHSPNKIISSLVLHQTPLTEKRRIIRTVYQDLPESGTFLIADYGLQRSALMRTLFRCTVQALDGFEDTQPNADGVLMKMLEDAGFSSVKETAVYATPSGSISVLLAHKSISDDGTRP